MKKLILLLAFVGITANAGYYQDFKDKTSAAASYAGHGLYDAAEYAGRKVSEGAASVRDAAEGAAFLSYLAWKLATAKPLGSDHISRHNR